MARDPAGVDAEAIKASGAVMFANPRWPGIAALLFAATTWGAMFIVSKDVLGYVDPFWFTFLRYAIAGLLFAALILPRGSTPWRNLRANAAPLAVRGVSGFGVFSVTLLTGLAHTEPSHGAVIMATTPLTTQLVRWALDGVQPKRTTLLTTTLALAGVVVVTGVLSHASFNWTATLHGDALILASTLAWVWYTRGAAHFAQLEIVEYTALTVLAALPVLALAAFFATAFDFASVPSVDELHVTWHAMLFVGVVASGFAILAFNFGVRRLGAVTGTAFLNFVPVSALLYGVALGKPPTATELVGAAMVIGALLIHTAMSVRDARVSAAPSRPRMATGLRPADCRQGR
jgi:drug/metabolite transporter (DMT)-like permease